MGIVRCPEPALNLVQPRRNLIAVAGQGTVVRVGLIDAVGKQAPVLGIQDEKKPVEKNQTVFLAIAKVARRIEIVGAVLDEAFNAQAQRFKHAVFQLLADADRYSELPSTALVSSDLRPSTDAKPAGLKSRKKRRKSLSSAPPGPNSSWPPVGVNYQGARKIDFKIGLEARLARPSTLGHQPPKPAIRKDAVVPQAVIEIPFDLLGRIFPLGADPRRPVKAYVPGFRVGDRGGMRPEIRVCASSAERRVQIVIAQKQRVVRFAAIEISLIFQVPAKSTRTPAG